MIILIITLRKFEIRRNASFDALKKRATSGGGRLGLQKIEENKFS